MIDAALDIPGSGFHIFAGNRVWQYDFDAGRATSGALRVGDPTAGTDAFLQEVEPFPSAILPGQDRGQDKRAQLTYVLSGDSYRAFDRARGVWRDAQPRSIAAHWPGLSQAGLSGARIDSAVTLPDGRIIFFSGSKCLAYDFFDGAIDQRLRPIHEHFPGLPASNIDAAVMGADAARAGKLYVVSGSRYWRYDLAAQKLDSGYPRDFLTHWKQLTLPYPWSVVTDLRPSRLEGIVADWDRFESRDLRLAALARIEDPLLIRQANTSMCGPAAILYAMAAHFPRATRAQPATP